MPPATKPRRITLADLSDEDRKALLSEAREAARFNPTDVEGYDSLAPREKAIRGLMDARDHTRGCPVQEGTELGRIEAYDAYKPRNPDTGEPARTIAVIRCVECGGSSVLADQDGGLEAALERAASSPDTAGAAGAGDEDETP